MVHVLVKGIFRLGQSYIGAEYSQKDKPEKESDMYETKTIRETGTILHTDAERGLSQEEAARKLTIQGPNELREVRQKTPPEVFLEQLNDPLIYVLLASAVISLLLHEISDAVIIAVVVMMNAFVGMLQEGKAQRALDSLKKLSSPRAYVIRDAKMQEIPAAELVTGDVVCLEAGCQVPADLRLTKSSGLKTEESALTGESLPITKNASFLAPAGKELSLGDRKNMAYMSTIVTAGRGEGIVTAVGMETEIGKIASLIQQSPQEQTPLQKKLGELGSLLSILSLILCGALFLIAVFQRRDMVEMLITAISLAVAAVPEGLPAVVTICLAMSVTRMVRVNTIVRKLPSVETLGAVSVVCSDKTGTLTQNRMTVEKVFCDLRMQEHLGEKLPGEKDAREQSGREQSVTEQSVTEQKLTCFLRAMVLCNDAVIEGEERIGDPTELALLDFAAGYGISRPELEKSFPRTDEIAFDSVRKRMSTFHRSSSGTLQCVKGAPDEILLRCSRIRLHGQDLPMQEIHRRQIRTAMQEMADQALRTLAVAARFAGTDENRDAYSGRRKAKLYRSENTDDREQKLVFLGLVGMKDPARPEAAGAVARFAGAGVDTVMITGDHVNTAYAIARQLGIVERREQCISEEELKSLSEEQFLNRLEQVRVFARVSPESKVRIVKGFRAKGRITAMTGDGVNDAPSLKAADIGIAMGRSGTDVARQASDMILTDDNFATIERAIEEGRGVYENIRKSVIFLLSSNLGEIMTMFLAVLLGLASPLKSSHILWINLITDSLPALALGADKNDGDALMKNPPRDPAKSLFADGGLGRTLFYGGLIAMISLTAFFTIPVGIVMQNGIAFSVESFAVILQNPAVLNRAQTYAFTVLGISQLFHAIGMRDMRRSVFVMNHLENRLMIAACAVGFGLQFAVTEIPFFNSAFGTAHLSLAEWGRLTLLAAFPLLAHEILVVLDKMGME